MDDVFAADPLFTALDWDGKIKLEFCRAALNANDVRSLSGGLIARLFGFGVIVFFKVAREAGQIS